MKYNNDSRIKHSKQNRDKIILAAKKLVFEKGYDKISVSEITKKAGVSKGSFYIHYHTKDDLIQDIINFTFEAIRGCTRDCLEGCPEKGVIYGVGLGDTKAVLSHKDYLKEAYDMGFNC